MMASFFRDSGGGGGGVVDAKRKRHKPRLDRRNAVKNIEYDASSSSSSSSSSPFRTSSSFGLDLETSFRIKGIDGELDLICQTLGFSGPEDFAIPTAVWEAEKSRSSSLISSRLRRNSAEADASLDHFQANNDDNDFKIKKDREERERLSVGPTRTRDAAAALSTGGMKGERPPAVVIVPASRVVLMEPAVDHLSSTRDIIMRSFVPQELKSTIGVGGISSAHEEHGVINEIEVANAAVEELIGEGRSLSLDQECLCESVVTESNIDAGGGGRESVSVVSQNGKFRRSITSWQKGEILGCGSFGTVYEGFTDDGFFFAVKEVSLLDQGSQGKQSILQLEQEISLLSQFEHENIVQYLGTDKDDNKLYIFLELATKGSLAKLYQKYKLRDSQVSAYTRQILNGLKYLHDRNVVHRDVKCANILVDTSGSVKLADFGLAKAAKLNDVKSCRGTALWMAPEVVNSKNHGYGLAADIWSLGCTVLEMLTGQHPYSDLEGMQALFRIGRGDPPPVPDSLSTDARDFIFRCLQVNPYDRPTAAQLLDNPFVRRPFQTFMSPASPYLHNWRS